MIRGYQDGRWLIANTCVTCFFVAQRWHLLLLARTSTSLFAVSPRQPETRLEFRGEGSSSLVPGQQARRAKRRTAGRVSGRQIPSGGAARFVAGIKPGWSTCIVDMPQLWLFLFVQAVKDGKGCLPLPHSHHRLRYDIQALSIEPWPQPCPLAREVKIFFTALARSPLSPFRTSRVVLADSKCPCQIFLFFLVG